MNEKYQNKYRIASSRLPKWDYRSQGAYFVTICTQHRIPYFGQVVAGVMHLSPIGQMAHDHWRIIPDHFAHIELGAFIVMPDHMHGIVIIRDDITITETLHATSRQSEQTDRQCQWDESDTICQPFEQTDHATSRQSFMSTISPKRGSLSTIIRSYKSAVTRSARDHDPFFHWQPRFHERIVRNEAAYGHIARYIINNPKRWSETHELKISPPAP